jgi:NAD(P)H-dependent FMN reductase
MDLRPAPAAPARLLLISGSQRRDSFNTRLLQHFARMLEDTPGDAIEIDLLASRDVALHARLAAGDGLIVASPEYNGQLTPWLRNLVDWVSRLPHVDAAFDNVFVDRPVLLCSASTGWSGGAVAIPHARALFDHVGALVIGDTVCVPHVDQVWSEFGYSFDPWVKLQVGAALGRVRRLARHPGESRVRSCEPATVSATGVADPLFATA